MVVEASGYAAEGVDLERIVTTLVKEGFTGKNLADEARKRFGVRKSDAYSLFLAVKERDSYSQE